MQGKIEVEAPMSLGGLFADSDSDTETFEQNYEEQVVTMIDTNLTIRQYSWHMANANKIWPGAFALAGYIGSHNEHYTGKVLELGAATGALSIYLTKKYGFDMVTSDIDDGGDVEANIRYNYVRNELAVPLHVPYTWGEAWPEHLLSSSSIDFIIASDILLYVSVYPKLVESLRYLFTVGTVKEFLMSWNRRIADSQSFFEMMKAAHFDCVHHGNCIYTFTLIE